MVDKEKIKTTQGKDRDKTRKFLSLLHDKVLVCNVVGCGVVWYGMDGFCLSLQSLSASVCLCLPVAFSCLSFCLVFPCPLSVSSVVLVCDCLLFSCFDLVFCLFAFRQTDSDSKIYNSKPKTKARVWCCWW